MIFKDELKIFQYHFPDFPIFPGALLLDYVNNRILGLNHANCATCATFSNAIHPNQAFNKDSISKNDGYLVKLFDSEKVFATITSQKCNSGIKNVNPELMKHIDESNIKLKPISNSSNEITFLDYWSGAIHDDNVIAVGNFRYRSDNLNFLSEISQADNFGRDFLLIEFMSLTVLSSLSWSKMIDIKDNYGFARLKNYRSSCVLHDSDNLRTVVNSKVVCNGIIWEGIVLNDNRVIASIEQGVDLPLKKKE